MYFFISYFDVNTSTVYVGDTMSTDPFSGFSKDLRNSIRKRNHDNERKKREKFTEYRKKKKDDERTAKSI